MNTYILKHTHINKSVNPFVQSLYDMYGIF